MLPIQKKLTQVNRTVSTNRRKEWIVIHFVGAVSTAKNNVDFFYDEYKGSSAHYFVDEKEIWQCVDDSNSAWHCGGAKIYYNDCRNGNSIGIEMCCKKDENGKLYIDNQTIQNTIELVQMIMKQYGIDIEHVVRHYDVTHKLCPAPFVEEEDLWIDFKRRVAMREITDLKEALDYLEEKGRLTSRDYWEKAITCVRNQEFVFIKWANDVKALLG